MGPIVGQRDKDFNYNFMKLKDINKAEIAVQFTIIETDLLQREEAETMYRAQSMALNPTGFIDQAC